MHELIQLIGPLFFFTLVAVLISIYINIKHKERMALIEKGVDTTKLHSRKYINQTYLRNGILLLSLAVGLVIGYIITLLISIHTFVAYAASLLICEGAGFMFYYHKNKDVNL